MSNSAPSNAPLLSPGGDSPRRRGLLLVVSSPSGAGKTTLCRRLQGEYPQLAFSVSYTTRPRRPNEQDGVDYRFVSDETFDRMIAEQRFVEWARVHGNRYGTGRAEIDTALASGHDMLFDVDWQGGRALASHFPQDTVTVFVLPPSLETLAARLRQRGTESPEALDRRLAQAEVEVAHYEEYAYLVVNDDVDCAYGELRAIYLAEQCVQRRRAGSAQSLLSRVPHDLAQ